LTSLATGQLNNIQTTNYSDGLLQFKLNIFSLNHFALSSCTKPNQ